MVLGDILTGVNVAVPPELIGELSKITLWIQAIGIAALIWIAVQIFSIAATFIRRKRLQRIEEKLTNIEAKLDRALKSHKH